MGGIRHKRGWASRACIDGVVACRCPRGLMLMSEPLVSSGRWRGRSLRPPGGRPRGALGWTRDRFLGAALAGIIICSLFVICSVDVGQGTIIAITA